MFKVAAAAVHRSILALKHSPVATKLSAIGPAVQVLVFAHLIGDLLKVGEVGSTAAHLVLSSSHVVSDQSESCYYSGIRPSSDGAGAMQCSSRAHWKESVSNLLKRDASFKIRDFSGRV